MDELTARVIEFWDNLKTSYPDGVQLQAADSLADHFMEESTKLDFGEDFDLEKALADDDLRY